MLQTDHNTLFILIMHHALALSLKNCPKLHVQLEDHVSRQAALDQILSL